MKRFNELSNKPVSEREKSIASYWKEIDLLHKSVDTRDENNPFIFYEGPPTANGKPGIHHVMARTLKDLTCRYKTMKGYQVKRKAGWDTHGLPVEIEVEKKLNLKNKQDIEKYGVEEFNKECRDSVFQYEKLWREMTERMAYLIDLDNPYITLENDYIESVWWILDKMNKEGLLYEGHKILPYCSRCGTGLASHEVALGYEEIKTETVTVKFKLKDKDEYFLAWTTTPWTLPSNVCLTVNPEVTYVKVISDGQIYYLAKDLADKVLEKEYEILEEFKGKDLEYMEYEQLIPFIKVEGKAFFVTLGDYVTTEDGTGIVHSAPAFGEDDYNTGVRYNLPVVNPVGEDGEFKTTPWTGKFVMDADEDIIKWLKENGKLYKKEKILHNYPHCWRCHTPLLYYAKPSWYIEVTKFKDKLIENNNGVNWYPEFVGEKRFGNWLENLNDWAITRSRYWGTPFPLWRCEDCGHIESVGSREELINKAIEDIDLDLDLHRPYVDKVHFKCPECGGLMTREKDVIDVWFDSGSMPFAQHHYPFEHKDDFDKLFPADFICEGIDQTRGWFYSLIAISTFVTGKSPYKNVLVNDLVLDKEGKKMSKSKGNTVDPFKLFDEYGADVLRWYLIYVSPPWTPTKFDEDGLKEVESKFFRSIRNVYNFFSLYANTDEVDPREFNIPYENRPEIDRWILSKFNSLLTETQENMEQFELTRAVRDIQEFVIEDLSNWYIRRNRRRFWSTSLDDDKKAVYNTTYEILVGLTKVIAPFVPFIAEELYRNLTDNESVHLDYYPEVNQKLIDKKLEQKMDLVRDLVALGRASRESVKIKVRQPLQEVLIDGKYEEVIADIVDLIKEELNVKEVIFEKDLSQFMNFSLKPNFKVAGPILGSKIKSFSKALENLDAKEVSEKFENGETLTLNLDGEDVEINKDMVTITISSKEGFNVVMENNLFVILDTTLTQDLIDEGYAREFISKVQQMRKNNDYEILDTIKIYYNGPSSIENAVKRFESYIKSETLATEIIKVDEEIEQKQDLNGELTGIRLERN
ncbi:isoleucine--tRNA ligase [Soehngenia longivitae]|uniref:Isoleucine--tRNA ligase n=1 Tax=Soehngenia longivitae TaxID=2562294 RepID=A0A4Z0D3C9_9FIRM|nr:isoleucine--tRNA ligase [Soehngenia longivitae]TFZ39226.1 isoleucine--tRNA ligase [Soehngenia longivitae]